MQKFIWEGNNEDDLTDPDLFDFYFANAHSVVTASLVEKPILFTVELPLTFGGGKKRTSSDDIYVGLFLASILLIHCLYFLINTTLP